jgi:hypothetical protein
MLRIIAISLAVIAAAIAATIGIARATLPATQCDVSEARFEALSMQMSYEKVKELLGCDGVLVSKQTHGQIVIERYAWRGTAWPYGHLRAEFINNTLQGTRKLWLNLSLSGGSG